jgi:hypothetical protein
MASNGFLVFLGNLATQAASNPALGTALSGIGAQLNNTGTAVKNARLYLARYQQALTAYRAATDPAIKTMLLTSVETAATALATLPNLPTGAPVWINILGDPAIIPDPVSIANALQQLNNVLDNAADPVTIGNLFNSAAGK